MKRFTTLAAGLMVSAGAIAGGTVSHTFDLSGLGSYGGGFFDNFPTIQHNFGAAGTVVMVEFDLNFTTNSPSWVSEPLVFIDGASDGLGDFIVLDPYEYGAPDASGSFQYADTLVTSIASDGIVSVTLVEYFDDELFPDAVYGAGSYVTVHYAAVPAPGAAALLGAAGMIGLRRRR
jgi:hypothetical protein